MVFTFRVFFYFFLVSRDTRANGIKTNSQSLLFSDDGKNTKDVEM